ncbi:MAG: RsfS/YbeB/iojap family protein [Christensenellales bacterium]
MDQKAIALAAAKALDAKKRPTGIILWCSRLDVGHHRLYGDRNRHRSAGGTLAENVEEELKLVDLFARRRREEGERGHWCILDYGDVMVHIFHEQDREYYQLERLWSNGTNEVEVALDGAGAAAEA